MSNKRKLRPPPTGWSPERFARMVLEHDDIPAETKKALLMAAALSDKKGRVSGELAGQIEGMHGLGDRPEGGPGQGRGEMPEVPGRVHGRTPSQGKGHGRHVRSRSGNRSG